MKKLTLEDYSIIKPYLECANYEGYNSNFVTMIMWNHEYHIEYEIHDHYMIMLHNYKGVRFWAMPFTTPEYYDEAIEYMRNYSKTHCFDFIIDCAIESFVDAIKDNYKNELLFERTPFNDDYIYDRYMLQTLSGKKMQKRRNHYNAFIKENPNYVYRELDLVKDFDIILECLNKWEHEKNNLSESMTSEVRGIMSLLSSNQMLDFKVGGIFINGKMESFIIGSKLLHSTLQIHVEKANKEIRGLYPAILKEFLEHSYPEEKYINREEDMGLDNLRKSKKALHPIKMIHKYRIYEKNFIITKATEADKPEIIELWKNSFKDEDDASTEYYFNYLYNPKNTYILKNNKNILSVLQIKPYQIYNNGKVEKSQFIVGVCTKDEYQNQGCMTYLLENVLNTYKEYPVYLQAYEPKIYRKFGFLPSHYHKIMKLKKDLVCQNHGFFIDGDVNDLPILYNRFTKLLNMYRIRDEQYWKLFIKRVEVFQEKLIVFKNKGYIVYKEFDDNIYVNEFIYLKEQYVLGMLKSMLDNTSYKDIIIEADMNFKYGIQEDTIITMMSNNLSNDENIENRFINEVY